MSKQLQWQLITVNIFGSSINVSNKSSPRGSRKRNKTEIVISLDDNQNNHIPKNTESYDERDKEQGRKSGSTKSDDIFPPLITVTFVIRKIQKKKNTKK